MIISRVLFQGARLFSAVMIYLQFDTALPLAVGAFVVVENDEWLDRGIAVATLLGIGGIIADEGFLPRVVPFSIDQVGRRVIKILFDVYH